MGGEGKGSRPKPAEQPHWVLEPRDSRSAGARHPQKSERTLEDKARV